jgi:hypothetical protein
VDACAVVIVSAFEVTECLLFSFQNEAMRAQLIARFSEEIPSVPQTQVR